MTKPGSEERYPLLLLYVEENGRKSEFPQRVVFSDKGRGNEVSKGAAAIITQWPAQVTSCWLTSVALGTAFIFISLCLLMSSLNPLSFPIHPRCTRDILDNNFHGNKTIHLVRHGNNWSHKQLDILRFIADTYPEFEIRNIMLDTSLRNFKKREKKKTFTTMTTSTETPHFHFHMPEFTNTFVKKLNEILKKDEIIGKDDNGIDEKDEATEENIIPSETNETSAIRRIKRSSPIRFFKPHTYEDILLMYPNIKETRTTYKEYFQATPLHYFWVDFSPELILFSARVLELWQNGGISFYLPIHNHHNHEKITETVQHINNTLPLKETTNKTNIIPIIAPKDANINIARMKLLISSTKYRFDKLTEDLVSIDGQGLHMATKVPCHSFFGEMIIKLQKDIDHLTIPDLIQRVLNLFCGRGAVDSEYCLKNKY